MNVFIVLVALLCSVVAQNHHKEHGLNDGAAFAEPEPDPVPIPEEVLPESEPPRPSELQTEHAHQDQKPKIISGRTQSRLNYLAQMNPLQYGQLPWFMPRNPMDMFPQRGGFMQQPGAVPFGSHSQLGSVSGLNHHHNEGLHGVSARHGTGADSHGHHLDTPSRDMHRHGMDHGLSMDTRGHFLGTHGRSLDTHGHSLDKHGQSLDTHGHDMNTNHPTKVDSLGHSVDTNGHSADTHGRSHGIDSSHGTQMETHGHSHGHGGAGSNHGLGFGSLHPRGIGSRHDARFGTHGRSQWMGANPGVGLNGFGRSRGMGFPNNIHPGNRGIDGFENHQSSVGEPVGMSRRMRVQSCRQCPQGMLCRYISDVYSICIRRRGASLQTQSARVCSQIPDPGNCETTIFTRYYYDNRYNRCHRFYFSGCGGNGNRFNTLSECRETCGARQRTHA